MAKVLQGQDLAATQAKVSSLVKYNYEQGNRTITSTNPDLKGRTTEASPNTAVQYNYWNNRPDPYRSTTGETFNKSFGAQTFGMALGFGNWSKDFIKTSVTNTINTGADALAMIPRRYAVLRANDETNRINEFEKNTLEMYKTGRINKQQYLDSMNQAVKDRQKLAEEMKDFTNSAMMQHTNTRLNAQGEVDWRETIIGTIDGAMTMASLGTAKGFSLAVVGSIRASAIAPRARVATGIGSLLATGTMKSVKVADSVLTTRLAQISDKLLTNIGGYGAMAEKGLGKIGTSPAAMDYVKNGMVELTIRSPLRRENMRFTADTIEAYKEGGFFSNGDKLGAIPATVLLATAFASGGAIGFITKNFSKGGKVLKEAMYGEPAFFDMINDYVAKAGVKGNIIQSIRNIMENGDARFIKNVKTTLQQLEEYNLQGRSMRPGAEAVGQAILDKLTTGGRTVESITMDEIVEDMFRWNYAQNLLDDVNKLLKSLGGGYAAVVKYDQGTAKALQSAISKAINTEAKTIKSKATHEARMAARKAIARSIVQQQTANGACWTNNIEVVNVILDAIEKANNVKALVKAPQTINAAKLAKISSKNTAAVQTGKKILLPKKVQQELADMGYAVTVSDDIGRRMKSADEVANMPLKSRYAAPGGTAGELVENGTKYIPVADELFEAAAQSKPVFRVIGAALTAAGMGIDDSTSVAYRVIRNNATDLLDNIYGKGKGDSVLNQLQQYVENRGITYSGTDLRMLRDREIMDAISMMTEGKHIIDAKTAKATRNAIIQAHLAAPLEIGGMANRLVSASYKYNPVYKYYARAQGALRYTWNPFFRTQEIVETEMLGQALAPGGKGKQLWMMGFGKMLGKTTKELDEVVERMERAGFFHDGMMMATRYGEAAQDVFLGRMSTQILKTQKRSLAGVVTKMAQKYNMTIEELVTKHPQDVIDLIRPIIQYPTKGVLNSNLAKALNIAVFPARYNLKVTALAVKALGQQPPTVQLAVINGLWELDDWMKSPAGVQWQRDNALAIGVFNWLTPLGSVQWVADVLGAPFDKSNKERLFDFGLIGGLPFGVFTQIIQSQGIVDLNSPYVNPENAEIYSRRIPESLRARAASAFTDLLGSTFTYPGRTLGLPGKGELLRNIAQVPFPNESSEWNTQIYQAEDLPEYAAYKQQIWRDAYLKEMGVNVTPIPPELVYKKIISGSIDYPDFKEGISSKVILNDLKQQAKDAKKAAAEAKAASSTSTSTKTLPNQTRTGVKKATFPSTLPQ